MSVTESTQQSDAAESELIEAPPTTLRGILGRLGPGLIVAGSIVGSGELIATTKTGAEAGYSLLWLILIGCIIKVFVQVEFGRYSISTGQSTMTGLNSVPGPLLQVRLGHAPHSARCSANWLVWYWFLMWFASIGQLGGIVGGVGQALAISIPLTAEGRTFNEYVDRQTELTAKEVEIKRLASGQTAEASGQVDELRNETTALREALAAAAAPLVQQLGATEFDRLAKDFDLTTRNEAADSALADAIGPKRFYQLLSQGKLTGGDTYDREVLIEQLGQAAFARQDNKPASPKDDKLWAGIVAVVTSVLLVLGRYGLIQSFSTAMVFSFTILTVLNLILLQSNPSWSVSWDDIVQGMSFRLPRGSDTAVATALATFGIIGVGASELVTYPYWCLEKGYARFTGPRDATAAWAERARGWMRVMRWDAWCSMVVYTFATMAFYLLGAAVLHRSGLNPAKDTMIRTLAVMYEPVFTKWASLLFLFGAFAVLYSTYFVANASHARVFSDTLGVLGLASRETGALRRRVVFLSGFFPLLCLVMYLLFPNPARLVLISGVMQAIMLPMLAYAALVFRFQRCDQRIRPNRLWDLFLLVSAIGMLITGGWTLWTQLASLFGL